MNVAVGVKVAVDGTLVGREDCGGGVSLFVGAWNGVGVAGDWVGWFVDVHATAKAVATENVATMKRGRCNARKRRLEVNFHEFFGENNIAAIVLADVTQPSFQRPVSGEGRAHVG